MVSLGSGTVDFLVHFLVHTLRSISSRLTVKGSALNRTIPSSDHVNKMINIGKEYQGHPVTASVVHSITVTLLRGLQLTVLLQTSKIVCYYHAHRHLVHSLKLLHGMHVL